MYLRCMKFYLNWDPKNMSYRLYKNLFEFKQTASEESQVNLKKWKE